MKIRFIRSWMFYEPGQVLEEMPDGQADLLIRRGIIEQVKEEASTPRQQPKYQKAGK